MALLSAEHLAGPGYIILNVMRGLNIIALASVVASSIVMLVKTFIVSKVSLQVSGKDLDTNKSSSSFSMPVAMSLLRLPGCSSLFLNAHSSVASSLETGPFSALRMALLPWVAQ
jgi:hypothetical protein